MILEVKDLCCGYDDVEVIKDISFTVETGEVLCLLGPNGVGKTTLFRAMLGFLKPSNGEILLDGVDISLLDRKTYAKAVGYVPQAHTPPFPYSVLDVVIMGRSPHIGNYSSPKEKDYRIAEECLQKMGIAHLKNRTYTEISGGERQLTLIARALAQEPNILIMDEPTSNLDYGNQIKVLQYIKGIAKGGMAVIMTTHSPNHAFLCATKVAALGNGSHLKVGTREEIITPNNLKALYGIEVEIKSSIGQNTGIEYKYCVPNI